MTFEVELKIAVDDLAEIEYALIEQGAELEEIFNQADYYYNHPQRNFAKTDEVLRVRQEGKKSFITYKGPKKRGELKVREEIETEIKQPNDVKKIFERLGFNYVMAVNKERKGYLLEGFRFCLDTIEGLGQYLEVELCSIKVTNQKEIQQRMYQLLTQLGIKKIKPINKSYLELLLDQRKR
jgi:adenylate cyclase class 2